MISKVFVSVHIVTYLSNCVFDHLEYEETDASMNENRA